MAAPYQAQLNTRTAAWSPLLQKDEGEPPQGIRKKRPQLSRKSAGLQRDQEGSVPSDTNIELEHPLPSSTINTPGKDFPQAENPKRKRSQEDGSPLLPTASSSEKRPRVFPPRSPIEVTIGESTTVNIGMEKVNVLEYWRCKLRWPKESFEPQSVDHPLAGNKPSSLLRDKLVETSNASAFRRVIDALISENRKLKKRLKRLEKNESLHLGNERLFEVTIYGLSICEKRKLEETLREFTATLTSEDSGSDDLGVS